MYHARGCPIRMSQILLTSEELKWLENLRFVTDIQKVTSNRMFLVKDLIETEKMDSFLSEHYDQMGSHDPIVTGSLFMKRYAFLSVIGLFSMSMLGKRFDLSPDNVFIIDDEKNGLWMPGFYLKDSSVTKISTDRVQRKEYISHLFKDHLNLIMTSVRKVTKLSSLIMWENVAVYIYWLYEIVKDHPSLVGIDQQAEKDFALLLEETEACLFGEYHKNPLKRYYTEKVHVDGIEEKVRVRKTCCFSYELAEGERLRCNSCPQTCNIRTRKEPII
ncbi:siderophore-iron reductase FhuF [Bacillus pakistanensis]|uniref:Siderophore-iron reductase FhuF n=2 Tax=Rossellomorea pakistanensis TaxID=992288 RepID=A0ABS2NF32_9BACI|nr:siderophore-iron reductase FhuF [Bacillus pakistanensis]